MAKDTREYSIRMLENARKSSKERLSLDPVFMPVGRIKPETFNDALNRILATSAAQGMTLQEAYESIQGDYDSDDFSDDEMMDFDDDDFEQSPLAEYETPNATQRSEAPASVGIESAEEPEPTPQPEPTPENDTRDSE